MKNSWKTAGKAAGRKEEIPFENKRKMQRIEGDKEGNFPDDKQLLIWSPKEVQMYDNVMA